MPKPIGFQPESIEKIIASAKKHGLEIPRNRSRENIDKLLIKLVSEIGTIAKTARELKYAYSTLKKHLCRIEGRPYCVAQSRKITKADGIESNKVHRLEFCQCCGRPLPKKPDIVDYCILTRTCRYCYQNVEADVECGMQPRRMAGGVK